MVELIPVVYSITINKNSYIIKLDGDCWSIRRTKDRYDLFMFNKECEYLSKNSTWISEYSGPDWFGDKRWNDIHWSSLNDAFEFLKLYEKE